MVAIIVITALAVRSAFFGYESGDYRMFFGRWYEFISQNGGFSALKYSFTDYNAPYLYLIAALTYTPISPVIGIKLISVVFDLLLGFFTYRIVNLRYPGSWWPTLAAAVVLYLPTVVLNSSSWAQMDAMYSAFSVGGLYYLLCRRPWLACLFFGLAISCKLQAIFLFPLLLLMVLRRYVPWRALLVIPAVYLALDVPALLLGANPRELLLIYVTETGVYDQLTLNAPNVYQYFGNVGSSDVIRVVGIAVTGAMVLGLIIPVVVKRSEMTPTRILLAGTVSVLLVPYFLPAMHERYFYLADALTVMCAFYLARRLWYLPIIVQFASLFAYLPFLLARTGQGGGRPPNGGPAGQVPGQGGFNGTPPSQGMPVPGAGERLPDGGQLRGGGGFAAASDSLVSFKILSTAMLVALVVALWTAIKEFRRGEREDDRAQEVTSG